MSKLKKFSLIVLMFGIVLIIVGIINIKKNSSVMNNEEITTISYGEIYNNDYLKITTDNFERKENGYLLSYTMENKFEHDINVQIEKISINNIEIDILEEKAISYQGKINASIDILDSELKKNYINKILTINIYFKIMSIIDNKKYVLDRSNCTIKTNNDGKYSQSYEYGTTIFEDENMNVKFIDMIEDTNSEKKKIRLFIHNKKEERLRAMIGNEWYLLFNDYSCSSGFDVRINSLNYKVSDILFDYSKELLPKNKVILNFVYYKDNKLDKIGETEEIEFVIPYNMS